MWAAGSERGEAGHGDFRQPAVRLPTELVASSQDDGHFVRAIHVPNAYSKFSMLAGVRPAGQRLAAMTITSQRPCLKHSF
jgi:hypothetical protein